jgi:histidyl-tRNA synthetase
MIGGAPTPGCGWAAGVERMLIVAGELPLAPQLVDLFVAVAAPGGERAAFKLAHDARRAGLSAQLELSGRSLKGQLKHADRLDARYVAIVDGDAPIVLRNPESRDQHELEPDNVIPTILRGSRLA